MAKTPEQYERERNGGLGRYDTGDFGLPLAVEALSGSPEYAINKRNRMINLEALHARGFKFDHITQEYYKIVKYKEFRDKIRVSGHHLDIKDFYKYVDGKIEYVERVLKEKYEKEEGL